MPACADHLTASEKWHIGWTGHAGSHIDAWLTASAAQVHMLSDPSPACPRGHVPDAQCHFSISAAAAGARTLDHLSVPDIAWSSHLTSIGHSVACALSPCTANDTLAQARLVVHAPHHRHQPAVTCCADWAGDADPAARGCAGGLEVRHPAHDPVRHPLYVRFRLTRLIGCWSEILTTRPRSNLR